MLMGRYLNKMWLDILQSQFAKEAKILSSCIYSFWFELYHFVKIRILTVFFWQDCYPLSQNNEDIYVVINVSL